MLNINGNKHRLYSGTRAALDLFICPLHFATNWLQYASMALTCWVSPIIISPIRGGYRQCHRFAKAVQIVMHFRSSCYKRGAVVSSSEVCELKSFQTFEILR